MNGRAMRNVAAGPLLVLVALCGCGGAGAPEEIDGKGDIANAHIGFVRYLGRAEAPIAVGEHTTSISYVQHTGYEQVLDLVLDPDHGYLVALSTVDVAGVELPSMPFNTMSLIDMKDHEAFPNDLECYEDGCVQQKTSAEDWDEQGQAQRYDPIELDHPVFFEPCFTKGVRILLGGLWGERFQLKVRIERAF